MQHEDFPSTRWSLIAAAGAARSPDDPQVDLVARIYRPALLAWLMNGQKLQREDAEDILQSFFADKLNGDVRRLLSVADPTRGQFRSLLVAAVHRHTIDRKRADSAHKRGGGNSGTTRPEHHAEALPAPHLFDRIWAERVVAEAIRLTETECRKTSRLAVWDIFNSRVILPAMDGIAPVSHDDLARRWCLAGASESSNLLTTGKRMFARNLRQVVSGYASAPSEVDTEMDLLWGIFARRGA